MARFGLLAPMGINYFNEAKNKNKWLGALIGFALGVFDFTVIVLSFDVFHLPALAGIFFVWHFGGILGFGLMYKTEENEK